MSKELVFKVVLRADTKDYLSNVKQSEATTKAVFDAIKQEANKLRQSSEETSKKIGEIIPKGAKELADALTTSLTKATGMIENAGDEASITAKNFTDLGVKSNRALEQLKLDLTQSKQKLSELSTTDANPKSIAIAQKAVAQLENEVMQAEAAFNKFEGAVLSANKEVRNTESASLQAQKGIDGLKTSYSTLVTAMAAIGVGLGVKELAEAADSYATLSARVQIATKDGGNFSQAMAGVHQVALATNTSLDATATLFTKINDAGKLMGITQQQALDLTKTVNQAIKIGGGSVQATEAAVQQFTQALQSGVLRGDEFNSIMEQAPGLVQALAAGLGKTTGELRAMAENGELSAERVIKAIQNQSDEVQKTYDQFPTTISNALQKIATSWQILIGEMDQANGASATVAQWLSVLADNLNIVEVLLDDIGSGFVWFGDQLKKIDPQTIEALKTALLSAYDAIKSLGSTIGTVFETTVDVINTTLGQIFNFSSGIDAAADKTNGFTKALQAVNVVFGFISDGFKALNIGINLIIGAAYDAAGAFSYWKSKITFGDTSAQAVKDFEVMSAKAQEYYKKSSDAAVEFKSAGVEAIRQIGLTQDEKNAERVANNQKALTDLKAQEAQHVSDYKAISDERVKLNQQLVDARKAGDQSAIDAAVVGLAELDKKEKAYQAESKKISDEKIKTAQDLANAQIEAATKGGAALTEQTKKTIQAQVAAQGLAIEFDKTGKAIVKAIEQDAGAAVVSLDSRLAQGRKAAAALGVDLDVSLNRVSEGFTTKATALETFTKNLELMGATGKQAAELTYEAWQKWADQAKSPAEIDAAKAKLIEFEKQGVLSAKQVEMGMRYLDEVNGKLPANISEVEKAYKLLGITSREEANKMADSQVKAFNIMQQSGTASAQQVRQALINMADKIYASGDVAKIAWYESQLAANDLESSVDSMGKASVKSMDELNESVDRIGRTARGSAADGFRELGRVAKQEAEEVAETWEQAMARVDKERKAQAAETAKGLGQLADGQNQMAQNFYDQLIAGGMEKGRAEELKNEAITRMNNQLRTALNGGSASGAYDAKIGRNESQAWMQEILDGLDSKGSIGSSSPKISAPNIEAPSIQQIKMPNIDIGSPKNVRIELVNGNNSTTVYGDEQEADFTEKFFRELEQAKKRM